jgi:hypothetical protein
MSNIKETGNFEFIGHNRHGTPCRDTNNHDMNVEDKTHGLSLIFCIIQTYKIKPLKKNMYINGATEICIIKYPLTKKIFMWNLK